MAEKVLEGGKKTKTLPAHRPEIGFEKEREGKRSLVKRGYMGHIKRWFFGGTGLRGKGWVGGPSMMQGRGGGETGGWRRKKDFLFYGRTIDVTTRGAKKEKGGGGDKSVSWGCEPEEIKKKRTCVCQLEFLSIMPGIALLRGTGKNRTVATG